MELSSERPVAAYNCTQKELYSAAKLGWKSYSENLPPFAAFSTKYTAVYGTTMKAALGSAKALPDEFVRDDEHKSLRIELVGLGNDCMVKWQQLASYIRDGFASQFHETKLNAAGHAYYAGASAKDWESVSSLMEDGKAFIADNTAVLTTPGGMPLTFETEFNDARTAFEDKHEEFTDMEQDMRQATDTKINANNHVYKELISMFEDGQKIFRNSASLKDRFVFDKVLALISHDTDTPDTGEVNGGTIAPIYGPISNKYGPGVKLRIKNTTPLGSGPGALVTLGFYTADNPMDGFPGAGMPQLANEQEVELTISTAIFKAYFNVHNLSPNSGKWEITFL